MHFSPDGLFKFLLFDFELGAHSTVFFLLVFLVLRVQKLQRHDFQI